MGAGASSFETSGLRKQLHSLKDKETMQVLSRMVAKEAPQHLRELLVNALIEENDTSDRDGSSWADLERGIFCLLQGAAYRVCRINFAADIHNGRAESLPYTWNNFVKFVNVVIRLYKSLHVVPESLHGPLDDLMQCIEDEDQNLKARIANFDPQKLTKEMAVEHSRVLKQRRVNFSSRNSNVMRDVPEPPRSSRKLSVKPWRQNVQKEPKFAFEGFGTYKCDEVHEGAEAFLHKWNRVMMDSYDEEVNGAMVQVGFWYSTFVHKLLAACSVSQPAPSSKEELEEWFRKAKANGEFKKFAKDMDENFLKVSDETTMRSLYFAWRLTRGYLNGIQKYRERGDESGANHRQTGDLSQYVAFIDVFLKRSYVEQEGMRVSFPYFIGPYVWTLKHAVAEIACENYAKNTKGKIIGMDIVSLFKQYMKSFATMYACPYCRHHLSEYVVLGKERRMYPVEYLFLGWNPAEAKGPSNPSETETNSFFLKSLKNNRKEHIKGKVTFDEKLAYITDPEKLRLFLWKLHNTVSSSISRSESWYQTEEDALYTSRYWPNIDAELFRQTVFGLGAVQASRVEQILDIVKIGTQLALLRDDVLELNDNEEEDSVTEILNLVSLIQPLIQELDAEIVKSGFLQEVYGYNGAVDGYAPPAPVTDKEIKLVRDEDFTLA